MIGKIKSVSDFSGLQGIWICKKGSNKEKNIWYIREKIQKQEEIPFMISCLRLKTEAKFVSYKLKTACMEMNKAGTLKVSKNISAAFSRFLWGFKGASVSNTGCWKTEQCAQISFTNISNNICFYFYMIKTQAQTMTNGIWNNNSISANSKIFQCVTLSNCLCIQLDRFSFFMASFNEHHKTLSFPGFINELVSFFLWCLWPLLVCGYIYIYPITE